MGLKYVGLYAGHSGIIRLPATIFHPYFIPEILQILNNICPGCKSFSHDKETKVRYLPACTEFLNVRCGKYDPSFFVHMQSEISEQLMMCGKLS